MTQPQLDGLESSEDSRTEGEISIEICPRHAVRILLTVVLGLIFVGLAAQVYVEFADRPRFTRLANRFALSGEVTVPTWYGTSTLLLCATLLAVIGHGVRQQHAPYARSWLALAVVFLLMSIDEGSGFHEQLIPVLNKRLDLPTYLHFAWVLPGIAAVAVFGALYVKFWLHLPQRTRSLFATAAILFVAGSIGFEMLGGHIAATRGKFDVNYMMASTAEEALEMFGMLVFIAALLDYLSRLARSVQITVQSATF